MGANKSKPSDGQSSKRNSKLSMTPSVSSDKKGKQAQAQEQSEPIVEAPAAQPEPEAVAAPKPEDDDAWLAVLDEQHKAARFATLKSKNDSQKKLNNSNGSGELKNLSTQISLSVPGSATTEPAEVPHTDVESASHPSPALNVPSEEAVVQMIEVAELEGSKQPAETNVTQKTESTDKTEVVKVNAPSDLIERIVFILGGPGSGKGTACEKLSVEYNLLHLSVGDLLRVEAASGSPTGEMISSMMKDGLIVPLEVTLSLVKAAIEKGAEKNYLGVLLDGFPRSVEQGEQFQVKVSKGACCLFFHCGEETMMTRLMKRAQTSGREDDNEETMKKRLVTFNQTTKPVVDFFRDQSMLCELDAEKTPEEVLAQARQFLKDFGFKSVA